MPPNQNLQPGMTGDAVKQLQQYLVSKKYMTQAEMDTGAGIYGPKTTAAVAKLQQANGVDNSSGVGYWGPKTMASVSTGNPGKIDSNSILPDDQKAAIQKSIDEKAAKDPKIGGLYIHNSAADIQTAYETGDWTKVTDAAGNPFSTADYESARAASEEELKPFYDAQQKKDTADTEAALQQKQSDFQNYLDTQARQFQTDKTTLDQNAADNGVLFSGGRAQKEQQLQDTYNRNLSYNQSKSGADIASTARDYGYKYGDTNANALSSYYNLGTQSYNPNVATGGVSNGGLSSVYNANGQGYQGTEINAAKNAYSTKALLKLTNKANKSVQMGYQYKM